MEGPDKELWEIKHVTLASLQTAFKPHSSWNALNDEDSNLVKFLNDACKFEDEPEKNVFSCHQLRILGLLWCEGDPKEKVHELYDNL